MPLGWLCGSRTSEASKQETTALESCLACTWNIPVTWGHAGCRTGLRKWTCQLHLLQQLLNKILHHRDCLYGERRATQLAQTKDVSLNYNHIPMGGGARVRTHLLAGSAPCTHECCHGAMQQAETL
jgi:hypothetical protein